MQGKPEGLDYYFELIFDQSRIMFDFYPVRPHMNTSCLVLICIVFLCCTYYMQATCVHVMLLFCSLNSKGELQSEAGWVLSVIVCTMIGICFCHS